MRRFRSRCAKPRNESRVIATKTPGTPGRFFALDCRERNDWVARASPRTPANPGKGRPLDRKCANGDAPARGGVRIFAATSARNSYPAAGSGDADFTPGGLLQKCLAKAASPLPQG